MPIRKDVTCVKCQPRVTGRDFFSAIDKRRTLLKNQEITHTIYLLNTINGCLKSSLAACCIESHHSNNYMPIGRVIFAKRKRGFNFCILGVLEDDEENCVTRVENLYHDHFNTEGSIIENTHRVGTADREKPRQIIARFFSRTTHRTVMSNARENCRVLHIVLLMILRQGTYKRNAAWHH